MAEGLTAADRQSMQDMIARLEQLAEEHGQLERGPDRDLEAERSFDENRLLPEERIERYTNAAAALRAALGR